MDHAPQLLGLPNELILYILRQFLDLGDVWCLLQVSRQLRQFAIDTIHKRWKIELVFTPETAMKIQCRAALIALENVSCQLSLQTRRNTTTTFDGSFNGSRLSPPFLPLHNTHSSASSALFFGRANDMNSNSTDSDIDEQIEPIQQQQAQLTRGYAFIESEPPAEPLTSVTAPSFFSITGYSTSSSMPSDDMDLDLAEEDDDEDDEEEDDDEDDENNDDETIRRSHSPTTMIGSGTNYHSTSTVPTPSPSTTGNSTRFNGSDFLLTTAKSDNKLFNELMMKEERLHQRIIRGISSYKHKYVLIEDIDIRNRIRATVDVIFHHAVFVSALSRQPVHPACTNSISNNRSLAAMMVRLLTRLDAAFPSYCREITYTLADHIKAFLEYTGYKLLAQRPTCLHERDLLVYPFIFGSTPHSSSSTSSSLLGSTTSTPSFESPISALSSSSLSSSSSISSVDLYHYQQHQLPPASSSLVLTLHTIAACFDLMGAAFVGKILGETHVECAVQRACELLSDDRHLLGLVKKALLVDLLDNWLTIKRGLVAGELCRLVRSEIEACSRQQQLVMIQQPYQDSFLYRPASLHTRYQLS